MLLANSVTPFSTVTVLVTAVAIATASALWSWTRVSLRVTMLVSLLCARTCSSFRAMVMVVPRGPCLAVKVPGRLAGSRQMCGTGRFVPWVSLVISVISLFFRVLASLIVFRRCSIVPLSPY